MALYGWCLFKGAGIRMERERGTQLLLRSEHVIARAYCAFHEHAGEAYRLLSTECDASDPHVQYLLGLVHSVVAGRKEDQSRAVQCYERAGNHIEALCNLALRLLHQERFRHRAVALYRQAATQHHAFAQFHLGYWYEHGIPGVLEKDIPQAKHWYSLSAEQDHEKAAKALETLNGLSMSELHS
eukprot:TRINITY_DN7877_c0_g3_i2.p1 TRINITY_DN7877_c0_g3~~TRINITY_DN7877_c0_g3_i2.p1  ORF type:complete len:200 (+),score=32.17 TRINITY_DN7877_c0_g3_i2:51-602(+)